MFPFSHHNPERKVLVLLRVWPTTQGKNERLKVEKNRI